MSLTDRNSGVNQFVPRAARQFTRFFALTRVHYLKLAVSIVLSLVSVALALVLPIGMRQLTNLAIGHPDRSVINKLALLLLGLFVLRAAANFMGQYLLRYTGDRIVTDLRIRTYEHLHALSLRYFAEHRMGDISSRLTNDVAAVRTLVADSIVALIYQGAKLIGSIGLMFVLNARVASVLIIAVPFATIVGRRFGEHLYDLARQVQERLGESTAIALEALSAVRLVKVFAREPHEVGRYGKSVEQVLDSSRRMALVSSLSSAVVDLLFTFVTLSIFWYGGIQVFAHRLTVGDLVAFLYCSQLLAQSVGELSQLYTTVSAATGATERLFEILDSHPDITDSPNAIALTRVDGAIVFEGVCFRYQERPILRNISFEVSQGEKIAVVGPSGAGKSTLLSLIPRLYDPCAGRVVLDGHDIRHLQLHFLRRQIAVVGQDVELLSDSVMDNIRYGRLGATDQEVIQVAKAANAHEFILELPLGYSTNIGERGLRLSGGQRQRVAIARGLLKGAKILILDEATSSIDVQTDVLIQEAVRRLSESATVFTIAHRITTVQNADRVFLVDNGAIVATGTHAELLGRHELYSTLAASGFREKATADLFTGS